MSKRKYKSDFLRFGFTPVRDKSGRECPQCVLCLEILSNEALKESKLTRHLHSKHPEASKEGVEFFQRKGANVKKQGLSSPQNPFLQKSKNAVMASYHVSLQIAPKKAAISVGEELINPAAIDMVRQMCGKEQAAGPD